MFKQWMENGHMLSCQRGLGFIGLFGKKIFVNKSRILWTYQIYKTYTCKNIVKFTHLIDLCR